MKRLSSTGISALLVLAACTGTRTGNPSDNPPAPDGIELVKSELQRETAPQAQHETLARDNQDFAFDLYGELAGDGTENLFFSPYSISAALAMTYAGARAETEAQMAETLRFTLPQAELHEAFNAVDLALESRSGPVEVGEGTVDGLELSIVNAAFAEASMSFEEPFLDTLALNYGAGVYATDFAGMPDQSRMVINDWVMDQTNDRIEDLLPEGSITTDTVMVLVNAIYFKANWLKAFEVADTQDGVFHAPSGDVTVPLMHAKQERSYAEGDGYRAVALPYVPSTVQMVFVLPDEGRLDEIEGRLGSAFLAEVRGGFESRDVDITLPRFSFSSEAMLKPVLQALGMPIAFSMTADFTGITTDRPIWISDVYHQAFVALDEKGTEAAAATAVVLEGDSGPPPPATITLDRPFLFMIYDQPTGQVLFLGRLTDPS